MNHSLAQELKDAGFPQRDRGNFVSPPDIEIINSPLAIYVPTLEELIEACGDKFFRLVRKHDGTFLAESVDYDIGDGTTPAEAVARLWLALNKKV
jgi:hypothetical protein